VSKYAPYRPYWWVLLRVLAWTAAALACVALFVWLCTLWAYMPAVLISGGFIVVVSFVIWIDQGENS